MLRLMSELSTVLQRPVPAPGKSDLKPGSYCQNHITPGAGPTQEVAVVAPTHLAGETTLPKGPRNGTSPLADERVRESVRDGKGQLF